MFHLDIGKLSAYSADRMIVPVRHLVETACTIAELYLGDMARLFQISQTVINGCETDRRQHFFCRRKYFIRCQVGVRLADRPQDDLTLTRQT